MNPSTSRGFLRSRGWMVLSVAVAVIALTACTSGAAAPSVSPAAPSAAPVATASPLSSPTPAATASQKPATSARLTPIPSAPDSGVTVELAAVASVWSNTSLDEPAGQVWHIDLDHQDKEALHNFTIASGGTTRPGDLPVEQRIFQSKSYQVGRYTIDVPAFPAGTYTFWCTIHPVSMFGTLTLK